MFIRKDVFEKFLSSYPNVPPENGGILGMKNGVICEYFHDDSQQSGNQAIYIPNVNEFNSIIDIWQREGIQFAGIAHSHLSNQTVLSEADIKYIDLVLRSIPCFTECLYFPIVLPNERRLLSFTAKCKNNSVVIQADEIQII